MAWNKGWFVLLVTLLLAFDATAEVHRYMVFFTNKDNSTYSIENPENFLSNKALQRRSTQNIAVDFSDLPVTTQYLDALKDLGAETFFTSRWMNAALIEADEDLLESINSLNFVKEVVLAAPGSQLSEGSSNGRSSKRRGTKELNFEVHERAYTHAQNRMLGLDKMHEEGFTGKDMLIGVFDSGFRDVDTSPYFNHLRENNRIIGERDFIRNSPSVYQYDYHGSRVLSCIGALEPGEYEGAAYDANFIFCVTEDVRSEYRIEEYNWLIAAEYADSLGVDVINSSVGYSDFDDAAMNYTYADMDGKTAVITMAATMAARKGIIVVASNGNEGNKAWKYLNAPADADSIISVGSVDVGQERSSFSSFGPTSDGRIKPDLAALGSGTSVVSGSNIGMSNGTSFSTPLITGLVAGFWQSLPDLSNVEIMHYLKQSANQSDAPDTLLGYGIPNFTAAFAIANQLENKIEEKFIVYPNPVDNSRKIYINSSDFILPGTVTINFFDLKGNRIKTISFDDYTKADTLEVDVTNLLPGHYIFTCATGNNLRKAKLIIQ